MKTLTEAEVTAALVDLPDWTMEGGRLVRAWSFPSFADAMRFVNQVAELAEARDHHPDIHIFYNRVELELISHDVRGITRRDIVFAAAVGTLSSR